MLNQKIIFTHEENLRGAISDQSANQITNELDKKIGEIKHSVPQIEALNFVTMLRQSILSQIIPEEDLNDYIESQEPLEEQVYDAHKLISMKGGSSDFIFLVVRGAIVQRAEQNLGTSLQRLNSEASKSHYIEAGGIAGIENILPQFAKDCFCNTSSASDSLCSVIELEAEPLRRIILNDSLKLQKLWGFIQSRYILYHPKLVPSLKKYGYRHIKKFMQMNSNVYCLDTGNKFKIRGGFILWQG